MTLELQPHLPTGYYVFADECPHEFVSEEEEPGDGIHVAEDMYGYLICLDTPAFPATTPSKTWLLYEKVPGFVKEFAYRCFVCSAQVENVESMGLRWIQRHADEHQKGS